MTVAELIRELQEHADPAALVVMSKDPEGNAFRPMAEDFSWAGWFRRDEHRMDAFYSADEDGAPHDEEFEPARGDVRAVCLWPGEC